MFKNTLTALLVLLCSHFAAGQSLPLTKNINTVSAKMWRSPNKSGERILPLSVDNSTSIHFPPIFSQIGNSCAQASSIGYMFTYEMNALLDRDALTPENRFSYLYAWNLVNEGNNEGSWNYQGLEIATSNGIMTEADFPKQRTYSEFKWASGFDKYLRSLQYKVEEFVRIEIKDTASLDIAKEYLYNKGVEGGKGGTLVFSSQTTGWVISNAYKGPSQSGYKAILKKLADEGGHAMSIVGYDDLIEFQRPDGKISKGAFIVVNSWGEDYWYHDKGRFYLPYWFFLSEHKSTQLGNDLLGILPKYEEYPEIVYKIALEYTSRNDLSFRCGISNSCRNYTPEHDFKMQIFNRQGGDFEMQGNNASEYIELGLDFSRYSDRLDSTSEEVNWFLTVERTKNGDILGEGKMRAFEVYDFRKDPINPTVYRHSKIDGQNIEKGSNVFYISSVEYPNTSYSSLEWLDEKGQPVDSPIIFRTADSKYAKVRFGEYDKENGTLNIQYIYSPSGDTNLERR